MPLGEKEEREAWKLAPLPELIHHLVGHCHLNCRVDMAQLENLVELAALEEGLVNPALVEVRDMVARFCASMRAHLAMEEHNLFPHLLGRDLGAGPAPRGEALDSLRQLLEGDHEAEAGLLRSIRSVAGALAVDAGADSYEAQIHAALKQLSERLQKHLYLETQVLFPRTRQAQ